MEQNVKPIILNLGCGFDKKPQWINVDGYESCNPDVLWDLNKVPLPWEDKSVDSIQAWHIFEHLKNWWAVFEDCARILKPGGFLEIHVPDESSSSALGWRDHCNVFTLNSWHGSIGYRHGTNAWAKGVKDSVPLKLVQYYQVPYEQYRFYPKFLLRWLGK